MAKMRLPPMLAKALKGRKPVGAGPMTPPPVNPMAGPPPAPPMAAAPRPLGNPGSNLGRVMALGRNKGPGVV